MSMCRLPDTFVPVQTVLRRKLLALFFGFKIPLGCMLRVRFAAMILDDSQMAGFMTGRIKAVVHSSVFVVVTVPIVALQALAASNSVALFLVVLCLAASSIAQGLSRRLHRSVPSPLAAVRRTRLRSRRRALSEGDKKNWPEPTSLLSMTGDWQNSPPRSGANCWISSRTATGTVPPWSPVNYPSSTGTR